MRRGWVRGVVTLGVLLAAAAAIFLVLPAGEPTPRTIDWEAEAGEPRDRLHVYWVGHSLMNAVDPHVEGSESLMQWVGTFAEARGHEYDFYDHTLYGAPLSLLWRGNPHSYDRPQPMEEKLAELLERGERYDALVMTEGIPIFSSMEREHSAYYAQRFYCAMRAANPDADVYLYETWTHHQASDPDANYGPPEQWEWLPRLEDDRNQWNHVADMAMTGHVPEPSTGGKLDALIGEIEGGCAPGRPIFMVPVARALVRLVERLEEEPLPGPTGEPLRAVDLFVNPYIDWPEDWPLDEPLGREERQAVLDALTLRFPDEDVDDVHPSTFGIWFTAIVHYATLYRRDPTGLPAPPGMPEASAQAIAALAWEVVTADPRTGV